jgi:hypothetical protein
MYGQNLEKSRLLTLKGITFVRTFICMKKTPTQPGKVESGQPQPG